LGVDESPLDAPPSRVVPLDWLLVRAPDGSPLKGADWSGPELLPARSEGATLGGKLPGTGASVQTFFSVWAKAAPETRHTARIVIDKRMVDIPFAAGTPLPGERFPSYVRAG
jgi:hypothetical protein